MLSVIRIDVFFLIGPRPFPGGAFFPLLFAFRFPYGSERLFAVVVVVAAVGRSGRGRGGRGATGGAATPVSRSAALDLVHFGGREAQARGDVVGDDLDDRALLTALGFPAALLEPA